jgi:hypothetical protein
MPKPDDFSPLPAPCPVTPPTLPPDFPDIPQNPGSDLQQPPPESATPGEVAGATLDPTASEVQKGLATFDRPTRYPGMRSSWTTSFSQGPHLSTRNLGRPVIVTEQHADPVELLFHAFRRLDAEHRRRLLLRRGRA